MNTSLITKSPTKLVATLTVIDNTLAPPAEEEIKDDQWLGVTLKSQGAGGKVLVR